MAKCLGSPDPIATRPRNGRKEIEVLRRSHPRQKGGDDQRAGKTGVPKGRVKVFQNFSPNILTFEGPGVRRRSKGRFSFPALVVLAFSFFAAALAGAQPSQSTKEPDWLLVARNKPKLKVLIQIQSPRPFTLADLGMLADRGLTPADRDAGLVWGLNRAVFKTSLGRWMAAKPLPNPFQARILSSFILSGIYRVSFKVEASDYRGPLSLEITAPREGFGRKLLAAENVVRPRTTKEVRTDEAGNRWLVLHYPEVRQNQTIHLHFSFRYRVDMAELLQHDIFLADHLPPAEPPPEVLPFLQGGYKIDPTLPAAAAWAESDGSHPPDARRDYIRLSRFIDQTIVYDKRKRQEYFGGRAVYSDLDQMYQEPPVTLANAKGACPDTVLLECAFLRARGIPCRTAGRVGHFFSVVYAPGKGWMSTSVTPTGIPLILAPGPDHLPYQKWNPAIPLRTLRWDATYRIEAEEFPCP